jgi:hypothetical protein
MKKFVYIVCVILFAIQFSVSGQKKSTSDKAKAESAASDSVEYELIVFDPGFDTWLATKPSKEFYSDQYYEDKNRLYVPEWNYRFMTSQDQDLYGWYIDYDNNIDYGLDLNYKLYYYFKYFEEVNKIQLVPSLR